MKRFANISIPFRCMQAMMLNTYDFEFSGKPEDVGMKTGATIHTMNGLNMNIKEAAGIPETNGWWELQHIKRGLSATGAPHSP
jgi:hypothetical protein